MIKLTGDFENALKNESGAIRRRRVTSAILLILMLAFLALVIEKVRGQWSLKCWKEQTTAKGEKFDVTGIWPAPNAGSSLFCNQLAKATEIDHGKLAEFAASLSPSRE